MSGGIPAAGSAPAPENSDSREWPAGTPRIIDLAPTILSLMGLPVPAELEGRALY